MPSFTDDDFDLENLEVTGGDEDPNAEALGRDDVEDAPIVRFVNKILLDAIKKGASDIHFEPYEKMFRIRTRIDGVLKEVALPPVQLAVKIVARLKVMARLDIAERRVPQDGRIKMRLSKNRAIDFRVSTCPTLFGEKVVTRILDPSSAMLGIDALGYEPAAARDLPSVSREAAGHDPGDGPDRQRQDRVAVHRPQHPQYRGHQHLDGRGSGGNQSARHQSGQREQQGGLTFAAALRAFLRQDPDVIMVGEIRDLETAEIAIKAAQTGHLVLSTLHTNDAPQTLTRLVDMGVKPYAIATSVSLIIAQRLARKLCSNCKQPIDIPAEALRKEGFEEADIATASGCTRRSAAANAPTATRAAWASIRSCRSPTRSAASSWKAAAPSISATRRPRTASGICAVPA
jgi:type IV pilus assembly protein PilB